jgi:hypothetical protein
MIWHVPKLGTEAHKKEKEFLKEREEENINYKEKIAQFKLNHMTNQDILLDKEEGNENRQKELLRLRKENLKNAKDIKDNQ